MKSRNRLFHPHFPRGPSHSEEDNVLGKGKFGKIIRLKTGEGIGGAEVVIKIMHKRKVIENKMVNQVRLYIVLKS